MAENATAPAAPATPPAMSDEDKAKAYAALSNEMREAIDNLNKVIGEHNVKVEAVKATESNDPKLIKAEIYEQNSGNNNKLAVLRKKELQLQDQIEKIRKEAYEVIDKDGLMPAELKPEQVEKIKGEVAASSTAIKQQTAALTQFEEMLPMYKGKLLIHINEVKTRRGTGSKSTASGEGPKRPRFKRIEINGVIEDDKGNKVYTLNDDGSKKFTFTGAANYLKKHHKGIKIGSKDLTEAYFGDKDSQDELPDTVTFTVPHVFKDESGNEHTVNYEIKATK